MTGSDLPPSVTALLELHLPMYERWKNRWPLWTYERREQPIDDAFKDAPIDEIEIRLPLTWKGPRSWIGRLSFTPQNALSDIFGEAIQKLYGKGHSLASWNRKHLRVREDETGRTTRVSWSEIEGLAPSWLIVRAAGGKLFLSSPPYESTVDVRRPGCFQIPIIDERDQDELGRSLLHVLLFTRGRDSDERTTLLGDVKRCIEDEDSYSHCASRIGRALLDRSGLLPKAKGRSTPRPLLSTRHLLQLDDEARDFWTAVRSYIPESSVRDRIVQAFPDLLEGPEGHHHKELFRRADRAELQELWRSNPWYQQSALIGFPFLTRDEMSLIHSSGSTKVRTAQQLVAGRLPTLNPHREKDLDYLAKRHSEGREHRRTRKQNPRGGN